MIDLAQLDELARRLSSLVPPGLREGREDLQQNFKSVLQAGLGKLDLVTREEFEVQRAVLARSREKLEALERSLAELAGKPASETPQTPAH
ncbi:MAG: accessory factor UbiK family protein [Lysobacteraceae bacterium]|nr:MAG: accessory factor UbiK family protein [Xanthomonadaceae bacterium]